MLGGHMFILEVFTLFVVISIGVITPKKVMYYTEQVM